MSNVREPGFGAGFGRRGAKLAACLRLRLRDTSMVSAHFRLSHPSDLVAAAAPGEEEEKEEKSASAMPRAENERQALARTYSNDTKRSAFN